MSCYELSEVGGERNKQTKANQGVEPVGWVFCSGETLDLPAGTKIMKRRQASFSMGQGRNAGNKNEFRADVLYPR